MLSLEKYQNNTNKTLYEFYNSILEKKSLLDRLIITDDSLNWIKKVMINWIDKKTSM